MTIVFICAMQQCYVFIYPLILSGFGFGYNATAGPVWYANGNGKFYAFYDFPAISHLSFLTCGMTWYRGFSGFCFLSFDLMHDLHVLTFASAYLGSWFLFFSCGWEFVYSICRYRGVLIIPQIFFVFIQNKLVSVDKPKASQELITHGWAMRRFQVVRKYSETLLSAMRVPQKSK